ncbi:MAG: 3-phosphoshikimate 1-carboxyvinyltransferase [Nitrospirae bacterium RBG_13_41_22]|nr:MAG: 3-phosphoshikimate 1-carboxyvinyltransferase [Nitrospirae bacterium RBG_13_41_22]
MDRIELSKAKNFKGKFTPTPDKSISHRAIIFSSLAKGKSIIKNFLRAEDPLSTMNAFRALGVEIQEIVIPPSPPLEKGGEGGFSSDLIVHGKGLYGLKEPFNVIDCGNSGTTMRMLSGVLAGNPFFSVLTGDESLRTRPMGRVINPLRQMGAEIIARGENRYPPIAIKGKKLQSIKYAMPVASAQVKSAILLAGLYTDGETEVIEPAKSRDHTERILPAFGADIEVEGLRVRIKGGTELKGADVHVPGDFSSAAFFIVAALLIRDSDMTIEGVGMNPTRTGLISALKGMEADIEIFNIRNVSGEPIADIHCKGDAELKAIHITKENIPGLIDEFPILCVAATQASGTTIIRGAEELRVKESDRIKSMATELKKMGAEIEEFEDGLSITGKKELKGAIIESYRDHRIAMALSIAALIADGTSTINGVSSVNISFPGFFEILKRLTL